MKNAIVYVKGGIVHHVKIDNDFAIGKIECEKQLQSTVQELARLKSEYEKPENFNQELSKEAKNSARELGLQLHHVDGFYFAVGYDKAISDAQQLCKTYFEIAAESIGESEVRRKRDLRLNKANTNTATQ